MTRSDVVLTVIRSLRTICFVLVVGSLYLTKVVIDQAGQIGPVDPTAVALVGSAWALAGSCAAGLAAVLISTRSSDAEGTVDARIVNKSDEGVPVIEADPEPA